MKAKIWAIFILFIVLWLMYFFIRHSYIIMSLFPVMVVLLLVVVLAGGYIYFTSGKKS